MNDYSDKPFGYETRDQVFFSAPWGMSLTLVTTLSTLLLLSVASIPLFTGPRSNIVWILIMSVMPLSIWVGSLLFTIRGYVLTKDTLYVRRLLWNTEIPLSGLLSAVLDPDAVKGSIRTFGNGGLFCFAGRFWNKRLRSYRAFATNSKNIVVLKFTDRTIVVTPSQPDEFVSLLYNK
jgi:hypothetical protein